MPNLVVLLASGSIQLATNPDQCDGCRRAASGWVTPGAVAGVVTAPRLADRTVAAYLPNPPQAIAEGAGCQRARRAAS